MTEALTIAYAVGGALLWLGIVYAIYSGPDDPGDDPRDDALSAGAAALLALVWPAVVLGYGLGEAIRRVRGRR